MDMTQKDCIYVWICKSSESTGVGIFVKTCPTINLFSVMGTVMGWGSAGPSNPDPRELQELDMPLVTLETCQRVWGWYEYMGRNGTKKNDSQVVSDSMICAGGLDGPSACVGDSGE